jgi:periplasmic divalent cation tolerance protein
MELELISIYTTAPDRESATRLSRALVEERLAACTNTFIVSSIYWWKGKIEEADEWAVVIKTRRDLQHDAERRLRELHPYEVPAILVYRVDSCLPAYVDWVRASTRERPD